MAVKNQIKPALVDVDYNVTILEHYTAAYLDNKVAYMFHPINFVSIGKERNDIKGLVAPIQFLEVVMAHRDKTYPLDFRFDSNLRSGRDLQEYAYSLTIMR